MSRRKRENEVPGWLWFFLALPVGLIGLLLYRRKGLPGLAQEVRSRLGGAGPRRYAEPDSIPLEVREPTMHPAAVPFEETDEEVEESINVDSEDAAAAAAAATARATEAAEPAEADAAAAAEGRVSAIGPQSLTQAEDRAGAIPSGSGVPSGTGGKQDDLKIIEGIGPSIAGLLVSAGIDTFQKLADAPLDRLDQILTQANLRHLADPGTWSEQAALAAQGRWEELTRLQGTLTAGRRKKAE